MNSSSPLSWRDRNQTVPRTRFWTEPEVLWESRAVTGSERTGLILPGIEAPTESPAFFSAVRLPERSICCYWPENWPFPDFLEGSITCVGVSGVVCLDHEDTLSLALVPKVTFPVLEAIKNAIQETKRSMVDATVDEYLMETVGADLRSSRLFYHSEETLPICALALKRVMIARAVVSFIRENGYVQGPGGLKLDIELPKELSMHA